MLFLSHLLTGWQLGRDHHSSHRNIRPQLVSRGLGWLREGDRWSSREIELYTLHSFGPHPPPGPAGPGHPPVLPGAAPGSVAGAPSSLWYCLWGLVSLTGFQAPHSLAGWLGAVCATDASLPAPDSSVPRPAGVAHTPPAALLLAVLWSAHLGLTGMGKCVWAPKRVKRNILRSVELHLFNVSFNNIVRFSYNILLDKPCSKLHIKYVHYTNILHYTLYYI